MRMASLELKELETSQPGGYHLLEIAIDTEITVLKMGRKFSYRIPSFSVLTVDLRQISYQVESSDGAQLLFDGFIRADSGMETEKPFTIQLKDFCFVTVSGPITLIRLNYN